MTEVQKKTLGLAIASLVFGCLFIVPLLGIIFGLTAVILGIIALVKISNNRDSLKGKGLAIAGISLGALGIIMVPIFAMLAAIAIPNLLRAKVSANEASAEASVMTLSTAAEAYAAANGRYPDDEYDLVYAEPPYLSSSYNNKTIVGYTYSVGFYSDGYEIIAEPERCGTTGFKVFTNRNGETLASNCE